MRKVNRYLLEEYMEKHSLRPVDMAVKTGVHRSTVKFWVDNPGTRYVLEDPVFGSIEVVPTRKGDK
jgi:hypothetical protein